MCSLLNSYVIYGDYSCLDRQEITEYFFPMAANKEDIINISKPD